MRQRVSDIVAAGAIVFRPGSKHTEVLLVHRPKYDDWSFPKGKQDRGEHVVATAVREVEEETGLSIRLGRPLTMQRYSTSRGMKQVHYWIGRVRSDNTAEVADYVANDEIDQIAWVPIDKALHLLSYTYDRNTLREALQQPKKTETVIVVRHGLSRARRTWRGDDENRPLLATGKVQANRLAPLLAAYGIERIITSPSLRCVQTVAPYAEEAEIEIELEPLLSERGVGRHATPRAIDGLPGKEPVVICSHRPVLPLVTEALGLVDQGLEKGELVVVHLRKGSLMAIERY